MNKVFFCVVALVVLVVKVKSAKIVPINQEANLGQDKEISVRGLSTKAFAQVNMHNFRPTNEQEIPTAKGIKRRRLTQTFHGIDVVGTTAEAELTMDGHPTGQIYGMVAQGIEKDIPNTDDCIQNIEEMINIAISNEGVDPNDSDITQKNGARKIYVDPDDETAYLVYRVEFFYANDIDLMYPAYFINACSKEIMFSFNQVQNATMGRREEMYRVERQEEDICDTDAPPTPANPEGSTQQPGVCNPSAAGRGGNPKTGERIYNQNGLCLDVQKSGNQCTLTNMFSAVVDNEQTRSRSPSSRGAITFNCNEGYDDAINEAFGVASDAFYFGDITGRLYVEKYGVRALPYTPYLIVHYDRCYDNAFWDGTNMYFGDGCSYFYPLVNQDVVTHELGHGITTRNSNLEYRRESGGINEAFSDISGEVAEVFGRGENDWKVGYELFKNINGALRYFINPADDGRSIKHVDQYYNGMDVHYSSGIFNHAFYQLVKTQGMPIYDAYKCFLHANLYIWGATTGFKQGACGVMQACYDNGIDHNKVSTAFSVVGIDLSDCAFDALATTVAVGQSRDSITVSDVHNPIIKITTDSGKGQLSAFSLDETIQITMKITTDSGAVETIAKGTGTVHFSSETSHVFVQLSSDSSSDAMVTLSNDERV